MDCRCDYGHADRGRQVPAVNNPAVVGIVGAMVVPQIN